VKSVLHSWMQNLLVQWVGLPGLCSEASWTFTTVSVSAEGPSILVLCWTLPVSLNCTSYHLIGCPPGACPMHSKQYGLCTWITDFVSQYHNTHIAFCCTDAIFLPQLYSSSSHLPWNF
jgi:hypothetical protein